MKIKRFNESEVNEISPERVNEIIGELKDFSDNISDKSRDIESILNEFNNYKSQSVKGNDQIDDSIIYLQMIKKDIEDSNSKIDRIINNLNSYNEGGRENLYLDF
jgi:methyl-accepting chemotaxis protein